MEFGNISRRRHIRWLPNEPEEPTSTLVLTSRLKNGTCFYVDLRVLVDEAPHEIKKASEAVDDVMTGDNDRLAKKTSLDLDLVPPNAVLEWAFAGSSVPSPAVDGKPAHTKWNHWVDSHTVEHDQDEGDMYLQPDGDTLEKGSMINPKTGVITDYEEVWTDLDAILVGADTVRKCVVMRIEEEESYVKGLIIRLGQFCQGILRVRGDVSVERWQWFREANSPDKLGVWHRTFNEGEWNLPCDFTWESEPGMEAPEAETVVNGANLKWNVLESYTW